VKDEHRLGGHVVEIEGSTTTANFVISGPAQPEAEQ